jgi:hypothetical protein
MKTIPDKCMDSNVVSSFCGCMEDVESVDVAVQGFCARAESGKDKNTTGDDLAELKKALIDLEEPE